MIEEAVRYATEAHKGQVRKGTDVPYITHPLEAAVIVSLITDDEELIVAALLHDVIEDAHKSAEEIKIRFGKRVADLVTAESEDKSKSWQDRKAYTISRLASADRDVKILVLGDKLSNMRSTAKDYMAIGDEIWNRFNETDKKKHEWYYKGVADSLSELKDCPLYQEYLGLCHLVFDKTP